MLFQVKGVAVGDEGQVVCEAVEGRSFWCVIGSSMVFCNAWFFVCVRSSMRLWSLEIYIVFCSRALHELPFIASCSHLT